MRRSDDELVTDTAGIVPFRPGSGLPRRRWLSDQPLGEGEEIPNRYEVREAESGRYLRSKEAPSVGVSIDRSYGMSEADARKLGERVILLDGAGQFGPTLDHTKRLYNLDHHDACLRAFTLATCEQALLLVVKGLELDKGDWKIYANEPDLDTLFAIWLLLNHRRVRELRTEARDVLVPLIRLEGAIDANGLETAEYCGLPGELYGATKALLDQLHAHELELKKSGAWNDVDLSDYAAGMLYEIDKIIFRRSDFEDFTSVDEEYGHVEIGHDLVAVVCRDDSGIYDVEKRLKKVWGDRLGIIALEKGESHYTLRRTASLSAIDLEAAYEKLNLIDPKVNGRPPEKKWGGSDEIGGSPRPGGTGLGPIEIAKILRLTYSQPRPWKRFKNVLTVLLSSLGLLSVGLLAVLGWRLFGDGVELPEALGPSVELALFALGVGLGGWFLNRTFAGHRIWLFGWRWPAGKDWLLLLPVAIAAGAAGAAWLPRGVGGSALGWSVGLGAALLAAIAVEIWFRGFAHGLLILDGKVQVPEGRWFVSRSTWVSALIYLLVTTPAAWFWLAGSALPLETWPRLGALAAGTFLGGLALGMIRERSLSLLPCVLGQLAAAGACLAAGWFFAG